MVRPTVSAGHSKPMTGGRLMAGLLIAAASAAGILTFGYDIGADTKDLVLPVLAALAVGFYAGWNQLGRNLGGEYVQSAVFGVGAGGVAVINFAALYGIRSAWKTHTTLQFDTGAEAVIHALDAALNVVISSVLSYPTLLCLMILSFIAGLLAEYFDRTWS